MATLFFLVQCTVGVLRPVKNAVAVSTLGEGFFKAYAVSAVVVLFVPLYNWLTARFPWRHLIVGVAGFFAVSFLVFWALYIEGNAPYGLVFYGWYDLFSAALVAQFFMATQFHVDARTAKQTFPVVIAWGSVGAMVGSAVSGFHGGVIEARGLLLVAAALVLLFGIGLAALGGASPGEPGPGRQQRDRVTASGAREVFGDPHVRLIAGMVLVTMLVKQLIDYQFNTFVDARYLSVPQDVIAFQGRFNLATQWLPLLVLFALRPALRRFGVIVAVLMLPVAMLGASVALLLAGAFWTVVVVKGAETTLRYSGERAGREMLYVPVPDELKLKAKAYIDVAIEKGLGKVVASIAIGILLTAGLSSLQTMYAGVVLGVVWFAMALRVRSEYVRSLARSIQGRFASVRGLSAALGDPTTVSLLRDALRSDDPLAVAFALDLLGQARGRDAIPLAPDLRALLANRSAEIRVAVLALVERFPELGDPAAVRKLLLDPDASVREAAVRAVWAARSREGEAVVKELLASEARHVRTATLACLARGDIVPDRLDVVRQTYAETGWTTRPEDPEARRELVLAAGTLIEDPEAGDFVQAHLDDPDPEVASTALLSAGRLPSGESDIRLVEALSDSDTRVAARQALAIRGEAVVGLLAQKLVDTHTHPVIRRTIPSVLARIPGHATVAALVHCVIAPETDQVLDFRTIKALSKLRVRYPDLTFERPLILAVVQREVEAARRYGAAWAALARDGAEPALGRLARGALADAWRQRREGAFRCLGLLYPPEEVHRSFVAASSDRGGERANALEWLERTLGHSLFTGLAPILGRDAAEGAPSVPLEDAVAALRDDGDVWVAACAQRIENTLGSRTTDPETGSPEMDLIEKVFLLQRVDLLKDSRSAHLALLASIAEEVSVEKGAWLIREGEPTEALYLLTRGSVEMSGAGGRIDVVEGQAFGTWALIDEAPSLVEARAAEPSRLLQIRREDFHDLVGDHPELAIGLLQGLARRIRTLVA